MIVSFWYFDNDEHWIGINEQLTWIRSRVLIIGESIRKRTKKRVEPMLLVHILFFSLTSPLSSSFVPFQTVGNKRQHWHVQFLSWLKCVWHFYWFFLFNWLINVKCKKKFIHRHQLEFELQRQQIKMQWRNVLSIYWRFGKVKFLRLSFNHVDFISINTFVMLVILDNHHPLQRQYLHRTILRTEVRALI